MTPRSNQFSVTSSSVETPVHQGRILVVEDERHIARFLEYVLRREGYEVVVEHDAEHALETARSFRPNALLLDMVLPGMSGIDLLRILRHETDGADLIVIILSAHWFGQDEQMLKEAGASAQCAKPIAPTTLIKKLQDLNVFPVGKGLQA
jgi:DNA-binding response OmpR family regulator